MTTKRKWIFVGILLIGVFSIVVAPVHDVTILGILVPAIILRVVVGGILLSILLGVAYTVLSWQEAPLPVINSADALAVVDHGRWESKR